MDDSKRQTSRRPPTQWHAALANFSPMWFALCISSGGLGLVLTAPFPYPARWLEICGDILFVVDLALFLLFLCVLAARWALYPRSARQRLLSDQQELSAYAIIPITLLTISSLVASRVSTATWGGHGFTLLAYVLWWAAMAIMVLYCATVIIVLSYSRLRIGRVMMPALFMPIVGVATAAVEAALISEKGQGMSTRLAVPMLVMAWFLLGIAVWMALMLYTIFLYRLLTHGWPAPTGIASMAILVGPSGQIASAFLLLGQEAGGDGQWADYEGGTFFTQQTGEVFQGAGTMMGLLFVGLAFLWFMVAMYAIVDIGLIKRRAKYTLAWWAVVFPIVTLDTALNQLANSMDSPTFRVLTTALFLMLMLAYLMNWVVTIWSISKGELLFPPKGTLGEGQKLEGDHSDDTDHSDGGLPV